MPLATEGQAGIGFTLDTPNFIFPFPASPDRLKGGYLI